jgi:hypothetical protein
LALPQKNIRKRISETPVALLKIFLGLAEPSTEQKSLHPCPERPMIRDVIVDLYRR